MCLQGGASPPGWHALLSPSWWPSSNLADRIDRPPSTPCRDCPWPLLVPNPASCGCCRRSSPRSRSTTTRPGHHHSFSPQRPCHPDATPREWLQPIIGDHDEIGTPSVGETDAALGNYCHHSHQPPSLRHVARSHRNLGHRHCRGRLLGAAGLPACDTGDARRNCRQSRCLGVIGLRFLRYVLSEASTHRCFTNIFKPW